MTYNCLVTLLFGLFFHQLLNITIIFTTFPSRSEYHLTFCMLDFFFTYHVVGILFCLSHHWCSLLSITPLAVSYTLCNVGLLFCLSHLWSSLLTITSLIFSSDHRIIIHLYHPLKCWTSLLSITSLVFFSTHHIFGLLCLQVSIILYYLTWNSWWRKMRKKYFPLDNPICTLHFVSSTGIMRQSILYAPSLTISKLPTWFLGKCVIYNNIFVLQIFLGFKIPMYVV